MRVTFRISVIVDGDGDAESAVRRLLLALAAELIRVSARLDHEANGKRRRR